MHLWHSHVCVMDFSFPVLPGCTQSSLDEMETEILRNNLYKVFTGWHHNYITDINEGRTTLIVAVFSFLLFFSICSVRKLVGPRKIYGVLSWRYVVYIPTSSRT